MAWLKADGLDHDEHCEPHGHAGSGQISYVWPEMKAEQRLHREHGPLQDTGQQPVFR